MSEASARLMVQQGPYLNQEYILSQPVTIIGRGPNNDIVFADPEVSRQHTQINRGEGGTYLVKDLGSTNGTFVNGRRISDFFPLNDGDTVGLGDSILLTFFHDDPGRTQPIYDTDTSPDVVVSYDAYTPQSTNVPETVIEELPAESPPMGYTPPPADVLYDQPIAAYEPAPYEMPETQPRRRRPLLIGCGCFLLLIICLCAGLFFLDAYDQGRLLYCGPLRPFFELLLGPVGFAPLCG